MVDVKAEACPLLLVFEGGGFILGQPEDGQKQDRRLADEVILWPFEHLSDNLSYSVS